MCDGFGSDTSRTNRKRTYSLHSRQRGKVSPADSKASVHGAVPSVGHLIYAGHADSFTRKAEHKEGACQPMAIKLPAW